MKGEIAAAIEQERQRAKVGAEYTACKATVYSYSQAFPPRRRLHGNSFVTLMTSPPSPLCASSPSFFDPPSPPLTLPSSHSPFPSSHPPSSHPPLPFPLTLPSSHPPLLLLLSPSPPLTLPSLPLLTLPSSHPPLPSSHPPLPSSYPPLGYAIRGSAGGETKVRGSSGESC